MTQAYLIAYRDNAIRQMNHYHEKICTSFGGMCIGTIRTKSQKCAMLHSSFVMKKAKKSNSIFCDCKTYMTQRNRR